MTFIRTEVCISVEVCRLIPENIKTKSLLKTNYNKVRVSLGSLCPEILKIAISTGVNTSV